MLGRAHERSFRLATAFRGIPRSTQALTNARRMGPCARCRRMARCHRSHSGFGLWDFYLECCGCRGCPRVRARVTVPVGTIAWWVRLHTGMIYAHHKRRRFARTTSRAMGYRCGPGMHLGRRRPDGTIACKVCRQVSGLT